MQEMNHQLTNAEERSCMVINKHGEEEITKWINKVAKVKHSKEAWFGQNVYFYFPAEDSLEDIVIKMGASDTVSGEVETLNLPKKCFHKKWGIIDEKCGDPSSPERIFR